MLARAARVDGELGDAGRLLFLDTETTGLAGGTGTYAFLVGAAWLEGDRLAVTQFFMRDFDEEPALLAALEPLLTRATAVVTFNGAGFDLPLLETRFVLARRRWPAALTNLDLLRPARRVWTGWLADCRLATLESEVLGLARDDDVPGALIPLLYFDYLRTRRAGPAQAGVRAQPPATCCRSSLWSAGSAARSVRTPTCGRRSWPVSAACGSRSTSSAALACYRNALAAGVREPVARWARMRLALWEKRAARWEAACALWEAARGDELFDPRPWEELAKFQEHRARDLPRPGPSSPTPSIRRAASAPRRACSTASPTGWLASSAGSIVRVSTPRRRERSAGRPGARLPAAPSWSAARWSAPSSSMR